MGLSIVTVWRKCLTGEILMNLSFIVKIFPRNILQLNKRILNTSICNIYSLRNSAYRIISINFSYKARMFLFKYYICSISKRAQHTKR